MLERPVLSGALGAGALAEAARYGLRVHEHDEKWRPARGYAGFYEVSCCGQVYSLPRAATAGGLLIPQLNSRGYRVVRLSKYGRVVTVTVAHLVLEAFDSPAAGRLARHGPGGKDDNRLANLRWS